MKIIQKLFTCFLCIAAMQSAIAGTTITSSYHPVTNCASLNFTQDMTTKSIIAPVGNAAWNFNALTSGAWTVKDCNNVTLGTFTVTGSNGVFTPAP